MTLQNSLTKTEQKKETISTFLTKPAIKARINQMMSGSEGAQFITSVVAASQQVPALQECDPMSVFTSAMQGQALKLSPSPVLGHFYMVPFNNRSKGVKEAQFVLGYKGYIQLAIRSGNYKKINVLTLKDGELISFDPLTEEIKVDLIQDEETREETPTSGYYAMFEYMNGFRKAIYWNIGKMQIHADKYSPAFSIKNYKELKETGKVIQNGKDVTWKMSSFWYKDFDGMALKTMLRQLISKWGIMSIDMQTAFEKDVEAENNHQEEDTQEPINITPESNDDPFVE